MSLPHTYIWGSQLDLPLRLQETLCVYRCVYLCTSVHAHACVLMMVWSIIPTFVLDTLSVSRENWDVLWHISNLILERWREICKLVNIWLINSKAQFNLLSFTVAWKFNKSMWIWMEFIGVNVKWISLTTDEQSFPLWITEKPDNDIRNVMVCAHWITLGVSFYNENEKLFKRWTSNI